MKHFCVDTIKCEGCGLCEKECGFKVISVNHGKARYNASGDCTECLHCFKVCPNSAITYNGHETTFYDPGDS